MSEMTLKQVRDILRNAGRFDIYGTNEQACDLADAIDAHLTRAPGQVTDQDVERAIDKHGSLYVSGASWTSRPAMRAALKSFSARLAQPVVAKVPEAMTKPERTEVKSFDEAYGNGVADGWNSCRDALLSQPHPQAAQSPISEALNTLEAWALAGNQLHGDDVNRFRAVADKISPRDAQGELSGNSGVLDSHGIKALDRCIREMSQLIELAADYGFDDMIVGALETGIESMQLRKQGAHPAERAAVPDGWVMVPCQFTPEMRQAGAKAIKEAATFDAWVGIQGFSGMKVTKRGDNLYKARKCWEAMLSAAPTLAGKEKAG